MATFVLIHPAWFGGWCWKKVIPLLHAAGHTVHTPTLTGLGERAHLATPQIGLGINIDDVVNVVLYEGLDRVILVGNSSSGTVITGVADRVPDRIGQLVYLDAFVPRDGQSMLDMIAPARRSALEALVKSEGDGWLLPRFDAPPWEQFVPAAWEVTDDADLQWLLPRLCPTPFGHFSEPVNLHLPDADVPPRAYIRSRWPHPGLDSYASHAQSSPGWRLAQIDTSHLPYITDAQQLATVLLRVSGCLG